jgi:hypothetical protein
LVGTDFRRRRRDLIGHDSHATAMVDYAGL